MILLKETVRLRSIERTDTELIVTWRNKESVKKNFLYQKDFTIQGHLKWMDEMVDTGKVVQFIIYDTIIGKPVGSVFLRDIDYINRKAEYGIFIGEDEARGKGLGTTAAKLILEYGFKELGLHKIFLRVLSDNKLAIRSYEKAGFKKEGYFKDEILLDGRYRDLIFMAVICEPEEGV